MSLRRLIPLLLLASCASSGRDAESLVLAPGMLPVPYTAEEIRSANQPGTVRVYRVVGEDGVSRTQTTTFTKDQGGRASFEVASAFEDGTPDGEMVTGGARWSELQAHASFPEADTTRSEAHCIVAAGTFDCWTYERRVSTPEGAREVHRFWFAKKEPGPPVLYVATRDGVQAYRMELIEVRRPG